MCLLRRKKERKYFMEHTKGKKVTVILPNKKKGVIQVDPTTPVHVLKKALLEAQSITNPENYCLAVIPHRENVAVGNIVLADNDIIYIFELGSVQEPFNIIQPFS